MILREFYSKLVSLYNRDLFSFGQFVNPLIHPNLGVQFVYASGHPHPPLVKNADDFLHPDPLAGKFYDLAVEGILPYQVESEWAFRAVVQLPDGELYDSSPIFTTLPLPELKGLASKLGIKWYYADLSVVPRVFTEMSSFDDCVNNGNNTGPKENCV